MRAQSSGEWPGSSVTCRLGLAGMDVCVGGGARPPPPEDGGPRLGTGPRARWAELAAGNWLSTGGRGAADNRDGRGGGGIMEDAEDGFGVGRGGGGMDPVEREKLGGGGILGCTAVAFGVVGDSSSSSSCSTAMEGGCTSVVVNTGGGSGGGGVATRSASRGSTIVGVGRGGEDCMFFASSFSLSASRRRASVIAGVIALRCSQARSVGGSHDGGRIMT